MTKPPRCDFCQKQAVAWVERRVPYLRLKCRKVMLIKSGACEDHQYAAAFREQIARGGEIKKSA